MSNDSTARRVWLLWDCGDLISAHASEAGAELARAHRTATVIADVGDEWAADHNLHISVSWHLLQG
jgi:hypothetical protein